MERRFSVEAKSFCLSAKEGCPDLRLEEKRKGFVGVIFVSQPCASWLVGTVEEASQSQVKGDIAKSYREGDKALMVHGGVNKAGSFLEVAVYAEGGRKGIIWLPEGRGGRGWRRFANELRRMLVPQGSVHPVPGTQLKVGLGETTSGCHSGRSFAEVLRMEPSAEVLPVGRRERLSQPLDLFPVKEFFEPGCRDYESRVVVDCFKLETPEPAVECSIPAAVHTKKKTKTMLGFFRTELGRVLAGLVKGFLVGLGVLPLRKRRWAFSVFIKGLQGLGFGSFCKPNQAGYLKSGWHRGRKGYVKSRHKSSRCVCLAGRG
jgi:hypothetical protein